MELKTYLWKNNLTLKKFSENLKNNVCYMSQIANYRRTPSVKMAKKIEKATEGQVNARDLTKRCMDSYLDKHFPVKKISKGGL